jgi:predicted MPP superfamily phosphohydrolase
MRLLRLPPPRRPLRLGRHEPRSGGSPSTVRHASLGEPEVTDFHRRHLFNPKDGWFRRSERATNKFLSRQIYPRIPSLRRPYGSTLDRSLTVSEASVPLSGLGGGAGIRVLVISDIHGGPFVTCEALARTFDRLLTLRPDLILLPGDFATVTVAEVEAIGAALERLTAPLGVFGVLGNHDYYTEDVGRLSGLLEGFGVELLQNRAVAIEHGAARFLLGGVDDLLGGRPDFETALAGRRQGEPTVILSHNPDVFPEAVERGVSLVVAGHTHGGQIRVPGLSVLVRMSRFHLDHGRFMVDGSELIVSRGLGVTGLPIRIACPPEALLLTFEPAPSSPRSADRLG